MNIKSKHVAALLAASAMAFGVTTATAAQPGPGIEPGGCPGMSGKHMMGDPAAHADQYLSHLKDQLKITPQQEPLWQAFADKVKASSGQGMKAMHESMQQPMTAPQRMDKMVEIMKARTSAMESANDSFKRLYDGLTPEQKTAADKFRPFADHKGPKHAGPRGGAMGGMGMGGPGGPQGQAPAGGAPAR